MAELIGRTAVLTIETVQITQLRVSFDIKKTLRKEPNTARISVWNLAEKTRKAIQKASVRVTLEAGYMGNTAQIFAGDLRNVTSKHEGVDWITTLETGDGEAKTRSGRVSKSFVRASFQQMMEEAGKSLGVGLGNLSQLAARGKFQQALRELTNGVVLNERSVDIIERLSLSAGLEWSIQDGQLQFLERGKALAGQAVLLTPQTGLLGSPELGEKGEVTARSLLQPAIFPGRAVKVQSKHVDAVFRCVEAIYQGDTHGSGDDWFVAMTGAPV